MEKELKNKRVKLRFKEEIEPHEILLDSLAKKKEEEFGKFEIPLFQKIPRGFLAVSLILIFILFAKTFQLQIIQGKSFAARAQANKFIFHQIQAARGVIYDKNLEQLVFNQPSFDLIYEKNSFPQAEDEKMKVLKEISLILKRDSEELKKEIEESTLPEVLIFKNLDHQTLIILETKIKELPGFKIENNTVRYYPKGEILSHLIGYTGKINAQELKAAPEFYSVSDYVGRSGLEKSYEEILRKNPGQLRIERDALGNVISQDVIQLPESGESLVLWLDSALQKKIKEELEKMAKEFGARGGAAVALDPKTGGVLALASYPPFDNNLFSRRISEEEWQGLSEDPARPFFNRVISGKYLTGSTIKPLIALAALEEKIISPDKKIDAQGKIVIQDAWNPEKIWEFKDWAIHGLTDIRKAIAQSVNVYFYTIGGGYGDQKGLGPTKIKEYLEKFGWNQKTGIDLPEEEEGFIPDKEWKKKTFPEDPGWWDGDTYNLSIGQGFIEVTPLEVAASFAAIVNDGKLLKPQVVQKIIDTSTGSVQVIKEFQPSISDELAIDQKNLQIVREGMRQAVTGQNSPLASAVLLNSLPVKAAAKTGTAQVGRDKYGNEYYHNWVTVFAPYEDPQIVLTVVFERIKGEQVIALPVAKEILEWYFTK